MGRQAPIPWYNCFFSSHLLCTGVEGDSQTGITTQLGQFLQNLYHGFPRNPFISRLGNLSSRLPFLAATPAVLCTSFWTQRHCCCLTWHVLHDFVEITAVHWEYNYSVIMAIQPASEESMRNPAVEAVTEKPSTERFIHLRMVRGWLLHSDTACLHLSTLRFDSQVLLT